VRVGLIIRPREGVSELEEVQAWVTQLRDAGHVVFPRLTFEAGDGRREAAALAADGVDLLIAAGGDGTLNEVANGALDASPPWAGRLAVLPLGTGNDFAAGLGIPEEPAAALDVAVTGVPMEVDVGRVNGRHFLNVSTGGFGASASDEAPEEAKRLLGPLAYVVTGARKLAELSSAWVRFEVPDGLAYEGEVLLFAVGNGKRTGGGNLVTPRAELDDGKLDVMIVPGMPRIDFLALLPDLRSGNHLDAEAVRYFRASRLVVEADAELSVNADGESIPGPRFEYEILPRALVVMTPEPAP
jgi:diacylglycerol kinase (ATP)